MVCIKRFTVGDWAAKPSLAVPLGSIEWSSHGAGSDRNLRPRDKAWGLLEARHRFWFDMASYQPPEQGWSVFSSLPQFRQQRMIDKNTMKQSFVISMMGIQCGRRRVAQRTWSWRQLHRHPIGKFFHISTRTRRRSQPAMKSVSWGTEWKRTW